MAHTLWVFLGRQKPWHTSWDTGDTESEFRREAGLFFRVWGIIAGGVGSGAEVWNTPELQGLILLGGGFKEDWGGVGVSLGGDKKGVQL